MNKWLKLIEKKEQEIIEAGVKAYSEAMENPHLRFIVELSENGEVTTWYDIASGNSFHQSVYDGKSIELLHFCMRNWENDPSDETVEQKLQEMGLWNLYLEERERQEAEDYEGAECILCNTENEQLRACLEECREEEKQFMVDEYAREETLNKLEEIKYILNDYAA